MAGDREGGEKRNSRPTGEHGDPKLWKEQKEELKQYMELPIVWRSKKNQSCPEKDMKFYPHQVLYATHNL